MKNSSYVFCSPHSFLLQLITSKKEMIHKSTLKKLHCAITGFFTFLLFFRSNGDGYSLRTIFLYISAHQFIPQSYNSISFCWLLDVTSWSFTLLLVH